MLNDAIQKKLAKTKNQEEIDEYVYFKRMFTKNGKMERVIIRCADAGRKEIWRDTINNVDVN